MDNKTIIITTEASTLLHKDYRLIYLTPGVITPKLARQPPRQKLAETSPISKIQGSHVLTATHTFFCPTFLLTKLPLEVWERRGEIGFS